MTWEIIKLCVPSLISIFAAIISWRSLTESKHSRQESRDALQTTRFDTADQQAAAVSLISSPVDQDDNGKFFRTVTLCNDGNYAIHDVIIIVDKKTSVPIGNQYQLDPSGNVLEDRLIIQRLVFDRSPEGFPEAPGSVEEGYVKNELEIQSLQPHSLFSVKFEAPSKDSQYHQVRARFTEAVTLGIHKRHHRRWEVEQGKPPHPVTIARSA